MHFWTKYGDEQSWDYSVNNIHVNFVCIFYIANRKDENLKSINPLIS